MYPIGTRVRVVKSAFPSHVGKEGRIVGVDPDDPRRAVYLLDIIGCDGERGWWCRHESVEPITKYDGNQVVEWSECLWQPEHAKQYPEE